MYVPPGFALSDEQIAEILDGPGLAQLVSVGASGLVVTPLPLIYDRPNARLLGHMAKANPHWREATTQTESVAIFPISDGYISPSLYATKPSPAGWCRPGTTRPCMCTGDSVSTPSTTGCTDRCRL